MTKYANSAQTYDALINAAGELAAELGFANVSTRAVASRADVNVGSLHYHFGGKDGLFEAVLRRVIDHLNATPFSNVLTPYEKELDTPYGQAKAVASIIQKHIDVFFDPQRPWWFSKVIYQALQYDSPFFRLVSTEVIKPMSAVVYNLLDRIKPGMSREEKVFYNTLFLSFCAMHSQYRTPILHELGKVDFSSSYIDHLAELSIHVAQQALGLPSVQGDKS